MDPPAQPESVEESPNSPSKDIESESNLEHSDSELEIDLSETLIADTSSNSILSKNEDDIIETIEDEIGRHLSEKAEKSNLTVTNVKSIIRQVLTNEHIKALLGNVEADGDKVGFPPYEPKLTRAKAKELLSSSAIPVQPVNIPWVPQPPPSETQVLIGEDLKEDDSGDEYVPGEEESEDDRDESIASESDVGSLPPPTPPTPVCMEDHATQTTAYTDDGVFKIPPPKTMQEEAAEEAANIALRTRSKINLSSTPLEVIEKSFVPPDITTDMYDMDCDDEEWREFLQGFTEPLEEATKPTEDEEHDPEYNILADDEINQVDNEDFRMDKAVKITKKEVKELWEELFDYLHNISGEYDDENKEKGQHTVNEILESSVANLSQDINDSQNCDTSDQRSFGETSSVGLKRTSSPKKNDKNGKSGEDNSLSKTNSVTLSYQQITILEQQVRQHVQMLTQNFFLTYEHPEFHNYSFQLREYLLNLKLLSDGKSTSLFRSANLLPALKLIDSWMELYASNCEAVKETKDKVQQELGKSLQCKMTGNWTYILEFPKLILETISKSEVFLYPSLLPKIPFKSEQFSGGRRGFTDAEDNLLVFGIDQFKTFLTNEKKLRKVTTKDCVFYVQKYMMPHRNRQNMLKHLHQSKHPRCATNPIQQYFLRDTLKPIVHYIYTLNQIPPCKRMPDELPEQWKNFIYPMVNNISKNTLTIQPVQNVVSQPLILINSSLSGNPLFTTPIILANASDIKTRRHRPRASKRKTLTNGFNCQEANNSFNNLSSKSKTSVSSKTKDLNRGFTTIEYFVSILLRPVALRKLVKFLTDIDENEIRKPPPERVFVKLTQCKKSATPNMPTLETPIKSTEQLVTQEISGESTVTSTTIELPNTDKIIVKDIRTLISEEHKKPETVTSSTVSQDKREKVTKNLEFSTITSSSFQSENASTEVEFYKNSSNIQICQTSQSDEQDVPSSSGYSSELPESGKDNPEDVNALLIASSTVKHDIKPNAKKELSGAEKKKNKMRREFLANLTIATPEDPESEKHKNEMFAVAYYDKLRETLELEDYHKIMQILNDFGSGDVIDLYNDVQTVLRPKYTELAEEFLFFLREKEAYAVGQLIPWLELQARIKFLRKLEIYFKDQPAQLKKIYNTLMELTKTEDLCMEKIKSVLAPLLKGNAILLDLFLQNFRDERPPPSLLEGHYETIDLTKELARPDNEELYETFVVPNIEDKYGGQNCICHCHKIEDKEYKSRYKHCNACGLKFANGKPYLLAGRIYQPATVTFKTSPDVDHNARLLGKSATTTTNTTTSSHRKKRSDTSPNKGTSSTGKENLEEDTEDEELGKRKKSISQKSPRKRKKTDSSKYQEKPTSPKKSPARSIDAPDQQKDIKPRKRTYSGRKSKKEENKKIEIEAENEGDKIEVEDVEVQAQHNFEEEFEIIAELEDSEHETSEEHTEKLDDECMDSSGESLEKPLTPGQQTAESESEIYIEESSQDNYESDDSSSSAESAKGSQSDSNTIDEPPWGREEDTVILETLQKEDDKEYALQIISDKLPNRTVGQIRNRLTRLMALLIETLKNT